MNSRKSVTSIILIVILLGIAGLIALGLYSTRPTPQRSKLERPAPLVEVQTVIAEDIRELFLGYGSARADQAATVTSQVNGEVVALAGGLNDGSPVEKGQRLVRIDDRDYRRKLERASSLAAENQAQIDLLDVELANVEELLTINEQEVELKRADFNRINELFEKGSANRQDFDGALLSLQQMRREYQRLQNIRNLIAPRRTVLLAAKQARMADAEQAQLDLDRCQITAVFGGQVDQLHINVGDRVGVGSQILRLVSLERMEIPVELPVSVRPHVALGAQIRMAVDSMPEHHWAGTLNRIAPAADLRTRTFSAYVMVDNRQQQIPMLPGYFLNAEVQGPMLENVLVVPRDVIVQGAVYVVNDGHAHLRKVNIDRYIGDRAVVTGELKDGDQIILTNLDLLYEGAAVRTVEVAKGEERKNNEK